MRRAELIRRLERVPPPALPKAKWEQVVTPAELAADLLLAALAAGDLEGLSIVDLGSGTGRLAIGAALLGGSPVVGVEIDRDSTELSRESAEGAPVEFVEADVRGWSRPADVVVMNPPFGAQQRHADRPFWDTAFRVARHGVYAFALAESREFIARRAAAAGAEIRVTVPVPWELKRTFPHHTKPHRTLRVDRWEIRTGSPR